MYNLQNGMNTENGYLKHNDYQSICTHEAVLLAVHMFDCDVTGVSCKGAVRECDH